MAFRTVPSLGSQVSDDGAAHGKRRHSIVPQSLHQFRRRRFRERRLLLLSRIEQEPPFSATLRSSNSRLGKTRRRSERSLPVTRMSLWLDSLLLQSRNRRGIDPSVQGQCAIVVSGERNQEHTASFVDRVVCQRLAERGIPFVFYTGDAKADVVLQWPAAPILRRTNRSFSDSRGWRHAIWWISSGENAKCPTGGEPWAESEHRRVSHQWTCLGDTPRVAPPTRPPLALRADSQL
jgi:hypothetical protein